MTNITLQKQHRTLWHFIPGLALSAVITGVALWGGSIPAVAGAGFSALTLAILLGMVLGNTIYPHIWKSCDGGVLFAKQYLLRLGIILYGFRLTFSQIADVGISGIIIDVLTLSSTFLLACFLGQKVFGLDKHTSWLIGAGSSICGAAAVLATEPVVKAEASKATVAVATVVIFDRRDFPLPGDISGMMSQWFSPKLSSVGIKPTAMKWRRWRQVMPSARMRKTQQHFQMLVRDDAGSFLIPLARVKQLSGANSGEKKQNHYSVVCHLVHRRQLSLTRSNSVTAERRTCW